MPWTRSVDGSKCKVVAGFHWYDGLSARLGLVSMLNSLCKVGHVY